MRPWGVALLGLAVAVSACHPTPKERGAVRRWLLCEECREGERQAVVALGDRVAKPLEEALRGPPALERENIRLQAEAMFQRIPSPLVSQPAYVEHYVGNYVATYQSRAASALQGIGSVRARGILLQAVTNDSIAYREDVLRALGTAAGITLVAADTSTLNAPVDSFVRAAPTVTANAMDGTGAINALANLRVVFRVEAGGGRVVDSVQRTSANGTASARWQLGPGIDSGNVLSATAAGRTISFRAVGRSFDRRLEFVAQPGNIRVGDTLATPVRVAVFDAWGARDTTLTGSVEMFVIGTGSTWVQPLVAGEATFTGLSFGVPGAAQRLLARAPGATLAVSAPFDILP